MNSPLHALHNEEACELLFSVPDGHFNDWVITTAFYSALHFALYDLFPLSINGTSYDTFSDYHLSLKRHISKHKAIIKLVCTQRQSYAKQYRWLYGTCMYARYSCYELPNYEAIQAKKLLAVIKGGLSKPV